MNKPALVIMAAGMGSRYGGLKQIDPVDPQGHIIIDFSIYDAIRAGFGKIIFVIKKENEALFRERIGDRVAKAIDVEYAFQELEDLPEGFTVPEGRVKPWGTGHAVLACRKLIDGPFAVINADDYYGAEAFALIRDYLSAHQDDEKYRYAMVSYILRNTLTENGHVARGVCSVDDEGYLAGITERTKIIRKGEGAAYTEDDGRTWIDISPETPVSMNMWGFSESLIGELEKRFRTFLENSLPSDPLKCEFFLPFAVNELLQENKASIRVLSTGERWYGVTYKDDKQAVMDAIQKMKDEGKYPKDWY